MLDLLPDILFAQGPVDTRPTCLECFARGQHSKQDCMWRAMGLDDDSMERSWYGALQLMREDGRDPDEVLRQAAENLRGYGPRVRIHDSSTPRDEDF